MGNDTTGEQVTHSKNNIKLKTPSDFVDKDNVLEKRSDFVVKDSGLKKPSDFVVKDNEPTTSNDSLIVEGNKLKTPRYFLAHKSISLFSSNPKAGVNKATMKSSSEMAHSSKLAK